MSHFWQIFYNIIGGALVAILTWGFLELRKRCYKRSFKSVFGEDSPKDFFIIYGNLKHRECFERDGKLMEWPYDKPGVSGNFKAFSVTSLAEMRSAKYLSETFGEIMNTAPVLVSDDEKRNKLDISFCSLGGYNNFKTIDVLMSDENNFFIFEPVSPGQSPGIIAKNDKTKRFCITNDYDVGFIIKVIPKNFPKRVWIAAAGLGEWGTSGAAWFLAKNWKKLPKSKSFGLIIKTKFGKDESAEIIPNSVIIQ